MTSGGGEGAELDDGHDGLRGSRTSSKPADCCEGSSIDVGGGEAWLVGYVSFGSSLCLER